VGGGMQGVRALPRGSAATQGEVAAMGEVAAPEGGATAEEQDRPIQATLRRGGVGGALVAWSAVALVPALWALTVTGREWSRPPAILVLVVAFLPYLYATAIAALFAVWCALPDRRSVPAAAGLLLVSGFGLWGPARGLSTARPAEFTMVSWNVRRLWGGRDAIGREEEVAAANRCVSDAILAQDPDVVALLEVTARDVSRLEVALGMKCAHSDYFGTGGGRSGLATCVRNGARLRSTRPLRFVPDEPWTYLLSEIERSGRVFNLLAVHLYPYGLSTGALRKTSQEFDEARESSLVAIGRHGEATFRAQVHQSDALIRATETLHDPTLIAGDFNSTPDSALHHALRRTLRDSWSAGNGLGGTVDFLGWLPLRIDYIYSTDDFDVQKTQVLPVGCSDHRPVVTHLALRQ
jgi:endonuclease/exonuclease/phosphatase family metal-dependent hydrolase